MEQSAVWAALARLRRVGLEGQDRLTARFVMGNNRLLALAITTALPFVAALWWISGGALWKAALVHTALVLAWALCFALEARGAVSAAAVLSLLAPLVAYAVQTWLLSSHAGFLLPMLMATAVSFVTISPRILPWRFGLGVVSSAMVAWTYVDPSFDAPRLDVSAPTIDGLLVANVALATVIVGSTSWLNDHYFTRERRRADRLLDTANVQARTDDLTKLANRRGMVEALAHAQADRPYAIALVDLDRFKAVNDRLGHAGGDAVLADVAAILDAVIGDAGTVSRWGGEEFLVLFPDTSAVTAGTHMERARRAVQDHIDVAGGSSAVTLSAGLAAASAGMPWEATVRVADALLYDAKDAGRNRVHPAHVRGDVDHGVA